MEMEIKSFFLKFFKKSLKSLFLDNMQHTTIQSKQCMGINRVPHFCGRRDAPTKLKDGDVTVYREKSNATWETDGYLWESETITCGGRICVSGEG